MNIWHSIDSERITKDNFFACIEISLGSKNKYELDKNTGLLKLDRILHTSILLFYILSFFIFLFIKFCMI